MQFRKMQNNDEMVSALGFGCMRLPTIKEGAEIDDETYDREIESLIAHVTSSRIDPQIGEILLPGQLEFRTARKRREEGIPVDDATWDLLREVADKLELDSDAWESEAL